MSCPSSDAVARVEELARALMKTRVQIDLADTNVAMVRVAHLDAAFVIIDRVLEGTE